MIGRFLFETVNQYYQTGILPRLIMNTAAIK